MPIELNPQKETIVSLPKAREELSLVDTKADTASEKLQTAQDPKYAGKLQVGASDLTNSTFTVRNAFLERFAKMDLQNASIEELMWMSAVASMIQGQQSEEQVRQADRKLQDSLSRKAAESVRAQLDWALTIAVIQGGVPLASIPSTPLLNQLGQGMQRNQGMFLDNLKPILENMTQEQAQKYFESFKGAQSYLESMRSSAAAGASSAEAQAREVARSSQADLNKIDQELQRALDLIRQILQQKMSAAQTATSARQ